MTDSINTPPDRLSVQPSSPHFGGELLQRGIGIRFKDKVRHDVEEYCLSEGWIKVAAGKSRDRFGAPMMIKLAGPLSAWFEDVGENGTGAVAAEGEEEATGAVAAEGEAEATGAVAAEGEEEATDTTEG